ncbi:hypothetical protein BDR26DRAFT_895211 [Obelidium mucronatum]|nr:hypothetical protein BDR26DRAFT_895211 [Obelidium mucronatum]
MTPPFRIPLQSSIRVAAPAKQSVPAPLKIKKLASNRAARSTSQSDEVRVRLERRVEVLEAQLAESDAKVAQLVEDNHLLRECSEKGLNLLHGCRSCFQRQMAHDARVWDALVISEAQAASAAEQSMAMLGLVEKAVASWCGCL